MTTSQAPTSSRAFQSKQSLGRHICLGLAQILFGVQYLALQIAGFDAVRVHHDDVAHAGRGQVEQGRTAEAARADH